MASNSASRKKSKKDAKEVVNLGSSDDEEKEDVKEGKKPKTHTLEDFHDNVFAVARTFRSPFTPQQFSNKYKQLNYFDLPMKPFGYNSVHEVLSATRDTFHEEDGTFFVYDVENGLGENKQGKAKNDGLQKKGKGIKVPTTLEEFHESILAVARSLRSSFTIHEFNIAFSQMFGFHILLKEFGYRCAREALFSVKGIRVEEDGDFIFVEGSLAEEAFAVRQTRLKELQEKISKIFKAQPLSCSQVTRSYQQTYDEESVPFATVGFHKLAAFLAKHPELQKVPGKKPRFRRKDYKVDPSALKELQDKVSAVARTLPEPFSCSVITDHYRWKYNEIYIPIENFGYNNLAEFCANHPELEEVRGKCGDLLFKMKNSQKKEKESNTKDERVVSKVSKRKLPEVIEEDLQLAERDSHKDPPKKKKRKDKEMEREQKEDENSQNDHGEKQSKAHRTDKVVSKKKHKKDKTVIEEESVEAGGNEVAVDLQTTEGGEELPKKKKKSKKRDEDGNANENDNRQNEVKEQSNDIKAENASSKKKEKVARVKENVEVKGNGRTEGHAEAATDSTEVIDVKPEKKEIGVDEMTKNVNENVLTTEAQDPMLMTAPFPHQMPPMPMHFQPMMPFAPPPSRHAILGSFITQMLEHAEYRGQNADDIASKLLQVINDSNKPNG